MAYVPPDLLLENVEAIGVPVPGGSFELLGDDGASIGASDVAGELVYRGPNVMMGYAESAADLARGHETAALHTGDLASRKANGCYVITGRKSRFSKIVGLRISLDEVERWVTADGRQAIVSGDDRLIVVAVAGTPAPDLKTRLVQRFGLPASALSVLALEALPTLPSGKFDYRTVLRLGHEAVAAPSFAPASLLEAYREVLGNADVRPDDSFLDLGGDSVNLVELSLVLENYLGAVPDNWEARPIAALEALKRAAPAAASGAVAPAPTSARARGGLLQAAFVMLTLLFAGEALLQLRSYLKSGRSAVAMVTGESRVVMNERLGINTYRPNLKDPDPADGLEFTTNALGFRSPEIAPERAPGELRIAVVGASTVAGAYARTNDATFPQLLQRRLRQAMPGQPVNVINAGIEGYTVGQIELLVERAIIPLRPHVVVIYPGFNDMAHICRAAAGHSGVPLQPLAAPSVPNWVLTRELISKNTVALRDTPVRADRVDLATQFPAWYGERLDSTVTKLQAAGITPVLVTVARAFKPGDGAAGKRLAATALFYNHCLDYDGLIQAGAMFNHAIADVAARRGAALVDLGALMPSGPRHFVDAAHFTREGEELSSELIYRQLMSNTAIARQLGPVASNVAGKVASN
jgi:lysophospholipase L1-like esterase/acyl carrier protein